MALAVVGVVTEVHAIDGADFIQSATVVCGVSGKWMGVVGKDVNEYDRVTVFLQDALLPEGDERWEFMAKHKWRVRMARFKGVPSECLIIKGAPEVAPGTDVTELLGVVKYEKPVPVGAAGDIAGGFPSFIPKTDEPNFQTIPDALDLLKSSAWTATEKADGTSCTVWNDERGMHVCMRNWELKEFTASGASNLYWRTARAYGLDRLPQGQALQFEIVGPGVQGNNMGLKNVEMRAFILYDYVQHKKLTRDDLVRSALDYGYPLAKTKINGGLLIPQTDEELRKLAEIKYDNGKHGEGLVFSADDGSWSFKVINLLYKD